MQMVPRMQRILWRKNLLLLFLPFFFFLFPAHSRPSGASSCIGGGPAVQGSHLSGSPGRNGTLQEGGFTISIHDKIVSQRTKNITVASLDFDIVVSGRGYKGILIRVGGAESDQVVTPTRGLTSEVAVCGNVGAVTHTNNTLKPSATASISLDHTPVDDDLQVDITVVVVNNSTTLESIFYYTGLTIQVVAGDDEANVPVPSPIAAPTATVPFGNSSPNVPIDVPSGLASNIPSSIPTATTTLDTASPTTNGPAQSVVDILSRNSQLQVFEEAVQRAGIAHHLSDPLVNFTLFAAENDAFDKLDAKYWNNSHWTIHLRSILAYHVVPQSTILASQLSKNREIMNTVLEENLLISRDANGTLALSGRLFKSQVIQTNALAENGVLHVVDSVFLPPFLEQTLLDVLNAETGFFSAMIDLIAMAGVESVLNDMESEYTLFAATNQAILAMSANMTNTLKNDTDLLEQVLLGHVIVGIYPSARFKNQTKLETLAGTNISVAIAAEGGLVLDDRTEVIGPDAGVAGQGLIHVVGSLLLSSALREPLSSAPTMSPPQTPGIASPIPPTEIPPSARPAPSFLTPSNRTQTPDSSVRMTDAPVQAQASLSPNITSYASYFHCDLSGLLLVSILILGQ